MLSGHEKRRAVACGQVNKEEMKGNLVVPVSVFEKKIGTKANESRTGDCLLQYKL